MLKKRIIPCLDVLAGRTVKGTRFRELRDAGCPVELARLYEAQGADELVFLDIAASVEQRAALLPLVRRIACELSIPFSVGGGIGSERDVGLLLQAGADKVCVNTAAIYRPELIDELARRFGSQCIVAAVDVRREGPEWIVYSHGGRTLSRREATAWARELQERGAGEILLTSMEHDGVQTGFAVELYRPLAALLSIPLIASGGAGCLEHFRELLQRSACSAALAAGVFHFGAISIPALKQFLHEQGVAVRWN